MAMICFEVVRLEVNDAYKEDPSIAQPAFDILSKVNGMIRREFSSVISHNADLALSAFQGLDLETPQDLFLFQGKDEIDLQRNKIY